jgi:peptidoglycan/LPS O-acetylase OafA/YrhL
MSVAAFLPGQMNGIGETFFTTGDSIACGCLLALGRHHLVAIPTYRRFIDSPAYAVVIPLILGFAALGASAKFGWLVGSTAQNVLIALLIERATRSDHGWIPAILNWRPLVLLGLWSYSVYLWQQPMVNRSVQDSRLTSFPVNLLAALVMASISYYLVEQPFLRLRQRLELRLFPRRSAMPDPKVTALILA